MIRSILLFAVLQVLFLNTLLAQDAQTVLKNVSEQYEKYMSKVDDMTMVMRAEGDFSAFDEMTTYYKKTEIDGKMMFKTHSEFKGGMGEMMNGVNSNGQAVDMLGMGTRLYEKLKDQATYEGTETVDGKKTHVIFVPDMSALMEEMAQDEQSVGVATDVYLYVDADEWIVRRMKMIAEMEEGGSPRKMDMDMTMSDFRQVGPMYQPFRTKTVIQNPMTDEERAELKVQQQELKEMLDQLPEGQREMMAGMMNALGGEEIVMMMVVQDLKVNEGVPAEFFD